MFTIPLSRYTGFKKKPNEQRRLGQLFYEYMEFDKVTAPFDRFWCDQLYNIQSDVTARQMIMSIIDKDN